MSINTVIRIQIQMTQRKISTIVQKASNSGYDDPLANGIVFSFCRGTSFRETSHT
jgi:hypothetical protein